MRVRLIAAGIAVVLLAALVGVVGRAALSGGDGGSTSGGGAAGPGASAAKLPQPVGGSTKFDPAAALGGSLPRGTTLVATARSSRVTVHAKPGGRGRTRAIQARREAGRRIPLTFSVAKQRGAWVKAYLPTRPNLSTGWIRAADVTLSATHYRIVVRLKPHRLVLYRAGRPMLRTPIAKGRAVSPTPTGRYFVTDLLRPPDPAGFYGPYALGLSAHSPVYTTFDGGDGQVGIHGTNQPQVLGQDVSHGCIRVGNATITRIAKLVPLGTPVEISRS